MEYLFESSTQHLTSEIPGSLSKGVFERRTATGNGTFSLFTRPDATTFVILSVFTLTETIYLKIRAHPLPKNEKRPLPVDVRRSKTPLLKLPIKLNRRRDIPYLQAFMYYFVHYIDILITTFWAIFRRFATTFQRVLKILQKLFEAT